MRDKKDLISRGVGDFPPVEPEPSFHQKPRQRLAFRFNNPISIPILETVSYFFEDTNHVIQYHEGKVQQARYGRYDNPTWEYAENEIARLEGTEAALIFPSGMNAISTVFFTFYKQGGSFVYTENCYRNIKRFSTEIMRSFGAEAIGLLTSERDFIENLEDNINETTQFVFIEAPSNPHCYMVDFERVKELTQRKNTITIVDSTFASPINFQPIRYGADLVIESCTKYLSGHGDLMMGCVAGKRELIEQIRQYRNVLGGISTAKNAALLLRSLKTLKMRMEYYNKVGQEMAEFLSNHSRIKKVFYLGLPSHPHYELGQRFLNGFGGVISFEVDGSKEQVSQFIDNLRIPFISTNFGTYCTLIEQYGIFTLYNEDEKEKKRLGINDQLIRLSLGFEDISELKQDIDQALNKM